MAWPLMAVSTGALREHTLDDVATALRGLAVVAARKSRGYAVTDSAARPVTAPTPTQHQFWNGVLQGICMSIGQVTGESTDDLIREFMHEARTSS